jgi:quercetin dioxygenase-like cupin family protein
MAPHFTLVRVVCASREVHMKSTRSEILRILPIAMLVVTGGLALQWAQAQQQGVRRTDLQQHDLSIPGRKVVQTRIDIEPGVAFPEHRHPGEEIIYVLEGSLEYRVEGKPPVILEAGDVLFIPAGTIHAAKNVGRGTGSELATYIVEEDKPLVALVK